jgi:hypothetical protein
MENDVPTILYSNNVAYIKSDSGNIIYMLGKATYVSGTGDPTSLDFSGSATAANVIARYAFDSLEAPTLNPIILDNTVTVIGYQAFADTIGGATTPTINLKD